MGLLRLRYRRLSDLLPHVSEKFANWYFVVLTGVVIGVLVALAVVAK
jgi:hypothetical protein